MQNVPVKNSIPNFSEEHSNAGTRP